MGKRSLLSARGPRMNGVQPPSRSLLEPAARSAQRHGLCRSAEGPFQARIPEARLSSLKLWVKPLRQHTVSITEMRKGSDGVCSWSLHRSMRSVACSTKPKSQCFEWCQRHRRSDKCPRDTETGCFECNKAKNINGCVERQQKQFTRTLQRYEPQGERPRWDQRNHP